MSCKTLYSLQNPLQKRGGELLNHSGNCRELGSPYNSQHPSQTTDPNWYCYQLCSVGLTLNILFRLAALAEKGGARLAHGGGRTGRALWPHCPKRTTPCTSLLSLGNNQWPAVLGRRCPTFNTLPEATAYLCVHMVRIAAQGPKCHRGSDSCTPKQSYHYTLFLFKRHFNKPVQHSGTQLLKSWGSDPLHCDGVEISRAKPIILDTGFLLW